ncbi:peptidoglycan-binding protein [Actinomadura nitritigenes]|uniref:Peptidoglycan-binding protein n=1 Tax=Actinomadura nitritigenes TaxID=134602 RepID=A0ABS3RE16_9ACTN|nr:peptidoglycan-binding protein [Actinomadura nitritigenes]MBO2444456.1 peptidoglycan-binding protein [Actinomadura nitritigenes]
MRRTLILGGVALVGLAGAAGWTVMDGGGHASGGTETGAISTGTAAVTRTDVAERQVLSGKLGYAGAYQVQATGAGVVTKLPPVGRRIRRGDAAYEIDGTKVPLMYGTRPVWRAFEVGMTDGADVRQLESNLKALGYGDGLTVDDHYSTATYWAVRHWQDDRNLTVTGTVPLGQIVFAPGPVRVSALDVSPGTRVQAGHPVEHGTTPRQAVTVQVSPTELPNVKVGDPVVVTLPDQSTRRGRVSAIGTVATTPSTGGDGGDGGGGGGGTADQSTAPVTVTVTGTIHGLLDQTSVQVSIVAQQDRGVLAVPTTALRPLPGGAYEVIVVSGTARRHVTVRTGLFDESSGLVEVTGAGLAAGQRVEVPDDGS